MNKGNHPSYSGSKNSQYGSIWIHRGCENKKIRPENFESYQNDGWEKGRRIKETLASRYKHSLVCVKCSSTFLSKTLSRTKCLSCANSDNGKIPAQRGTHAGWHNRRGESSYPEKYFETLFEKESIHGWSREHKVGRWFIDFAFLEKKIALEIDGRQHDDRVELDKLKDNHLIMNGWDVIRIRWYNPVTESNKEKLYKQVLPLLDKLR